MKECETSTQNIFCQEALCLLGKCILTLHNESQGLSRGAKMMEEIESILALRAKGQNAVNVVDPEVRGYLRDMGFLLADMEGNLTRMQLDVSEFAWRAGLVTDGLGGLKPKSKASKIKKENLNANKKI